MKECNLCKAPKELGAFSVHKGKKDGHQGTCKECAAARTREWYSKNRERTMRKNERNLRERQRFAIEYLRVHPCVDCGEKDPVVLEFDHRDDVEKIECVSQMIKGLFAFDKIEAEIAKCDVRCANCHRRKTAKQFNFYRISLQAAV